MNRQLLVAIILASSGLASGADPCGQRPVDALKQAASDIFGPGDHVVSKVWLTHLISSLPWY